jgi:hypothetical protein
MTIFTCAERYKRKIKHKYHEIDGTGGIEEVRDRIFDVMDQL